MAQRHPVLSETPAVELVCQPHGKDNLFGHVWTSSADDAPCKCAMAVTWAMLGIRSIAKTRAPRKRRTKEEKP